MKYAVLLSADDTLPSQTICDTLSNKIQRHICVITENGEKTYVPISDAVPDKENCYLIENSFVSHCEGDNQINLTEQDMETNCAIELLEENAVLQVLTTNKDPFMPSVSQEENNDEEECMMDANKENESKTPTRKRKIETKEWKRNQRKQARTHGKSYLSSRKKKVDGKRLKEVSCHCHYSCKKFSCINREEFFEEYCMDSYEAQRIYLSQLIEEHRCTTHNKLFHRKYYLKLNDERLQVCRAFFIATFDIGKRTVEVVVQKKREKTSQKDLRKCG